MYPIIAMLCIAFYVINKARARGFGSTYRQASSLLSHENQRFTKEIKKLKMELKLLKQDKQLLEIDVNLLRQNIRAYSIVKEVVRKQKIEIDSLHIELAQRAQRELTDHINNLN